ncbi:MAG: hypothetical protein EZS28_003672 [Streblomastix strix]|uniref:Uncharacterized protein n=1 Tax=Streblomastix strix TaxID=222440 RepID=A0A5J4X0B2_9EUKA|nr:MAG: hypothetical protein EZS28_003672 [Streblomastix strix]
MQESQTEMDYNNLRKEMIVKSSEEQIEEEGANEESDAQMVNRYGQYGNRINYDANRAKRIILNYFIEQGNTRPDWY